MVENTYVYFEPEKIQKKVGNLKLWTKHPLYHPGKKIVFFGAYYIQYVYIYMCNYIYVCVDMHKSLT